MSNYKPSDFDWDFKDIEIEADKREELDEARKQAKAIQDLSKALDDAFGNINYSNSDDEKTEELDLVPLCEWPFSEPATESKQEDFFQLIDKHFDDIQHKPCVEAGVAIRSAEMGYEAWYPCKYCGRWMRSVNDPKDDVIYTCHERKD